MGSIPGMVPDFPAAMKTRIPAPDTLAAYERAAEEIGELRRKGIPCHLEEHGDPGGHCIDVIRDDGVERDKPQGRTQDGFSGDK